MPGRAKGGGRHCEGCGAELPFAGAPCPVCPPPAAAPPSREEKAPPALCVPGVRVRKGRRAFDAVLLIREEGVFLFFTAVERHRTAWHEAAGAAIDWAGGLLGGVAKDAFDDFDSEVRTPKGAVLADEYRWAYERVLAEAPELARSIYCLHLPKSEGLEAVFRGSRFLDLRAGPTLLELRGDFGSRNALQFMAWRGYSPRQEAPGYGRLFGMGALAFFAAWEAWRWLEGTHETNSIVYRWIVLPLDEAWFAAQQTGKDGDVLVALFVAGLLAALVYIIWYADREVR